MSNLQTNSWLKLDFQKVDLHTGGHWLIHNTKHRQDTQFQNLEIYTSQLRIQIWHKGILW